MKIAFPLTATILTCLISAIGIIALTPLIFAGRVTPGIQAGANTLTGISGGDLPSVVDNYASDISSQNVTLRLRDTANTYQLKDLGIAVNKKDTIAAIQNKSLLDFVANQSVIPPLITIDQQILSQRAAADFSSILNSPQNASLALDSPDQLTLVPSHDGQVVDTQQLITNLESVITAQRWDATIDLAVVVASAEVQDNETNLALTYANQLLTNGFSLTFNEEEIIIKPFTIRRLLTFAEQTDPHNQQNYILGVQFDPIELTNYLTTTISPEIDQAAENARFVMQDGRVEQFSLPQPGQQLDLARTTDNIASALTRREHNTTLAVAVTEPAVAGLADIKQLGLTTKVSTGVSDFAGSPTNRQHNIAVGAARYHGLLIPPNTEFSFNEFLGPVNAATGFKPELVIKENVTTPEYGGGLCQVSTTAFRAALNAGLDITQRRNHSYAVSYYGKPGLDATIYPPYTDLRFLNNTLGYILIQTSIDGTSLSFDFWGTDDGREVTIDGPVTYDHGSDGSVKAYVNQQVALAGETIIDETFYSRYKSPKLFPRVLAANGETGEPQANGTQAPTEDPKAKDASSATEKPPAPTPTNPKAPAKKVNETKPTPTPKKPINQTE